jgi:DNA invertase Pin-like site-specific DNA recombinase
MLAKRASRTTKSRRVFGHGPKTQIRAGLYARVSTYDQQTLRLQNRAMQDSVRELRRKRIDAARRRDIDVVIVWRLDRWGRSMADLVTTLQELRDLEVGFVSLTEALDLTTPSGRAMAGLLAVFAEFEREILRERVRAGLAHARENGIRLGRPPTAALNEKHIRRLFRAGVTKAAIARQLQIGRTSVRRILAAKK